jgi:NTE family protein
VGRSDASRAQWFRRVGGRRRERIAFVFSGGGPLGALQVGAVLALFDGGIRPDLLVGTSVGALNASFLAFDPTSNGGRALEAIWRGLTDDDLFPGGRFRAPWTKMLMRGDRVFESSGVARLIDDKLWPGARFEDALLPLGIVATDLETGAEVVFTSGRIREPLMASTAMPSVFPPVEIDGRSYIDGGVSDNVPIKPAVDMGATTLYVMNATSHINKRRPLVRPMDYLLHAFTLARSQRLSLDVEQYRERVRLVMLPTANLDFYVPFASMDFTGRLIEASYEQTRLFLEGLGEAEPPLARAE